MKLSNTNIAFQKLYLGDSKNVEHLKEAREQVIDYFGPGVANHLCENDARILDLRGIKPKSSEDIVGSTEYDAFIKPNQNNDGATITLQHSSENEEIASITLSKNNFDRSKLNYSITSGAPIEDKQGSIQNFAKSIVELINNVLSKVKETESA